MKTKTKKWVIAAGILLLVLAAAAGIFMTNRKLSRDEYVKQMDQAEKYLAENDMEGAILAYENAIQAEPKEAEAYQGIAQTYVEMENLSQAKYYLKLGIKRASNPGKLKFMLKKVLGDTSETPKLHEDAKEETEEEETEEISVSGTIVDAVTGGGVADTRIAFTAKENGAGTGTGEAAAAQDIRTKVNGTYEVKLTPGEYELTVTADGYIEEQFSLTVENKELKNQNFTISPELASGEIRIVLEWGAAPRDLDAYLFADTLEDSGPVYFGAKGSAEKGAALDVDDRDGYGPETITITDAAHTWIYGVKDYTRSGNGLSASQATVKVYVPGQTPKVYTPPAGAGDYWTVCKIVNGVVQDVGKLGDDFRM